MPIITIVDAKKSLDSLQNPAQWMDAQWTEALAWADNYINERFEAIGGIVATADYYPHLQDIEALLTLAELNNDSALKKACDDHITDILSRNPIVGTRAIGDYPKWVKTRTATGTYRKLI